MEKISIIKPDDWHVHLRDNQCLHRTVADSARCFARAIVMPNLSPPVTDITAAKQYRERIMQAIPDGLAFQPLMTLYLTNQTTKQTVIDAAQSGIIYGCKLYPAHATTHSEHGVKNIRALHDVLATMAELRLPLLIHGEVVDANIDIFDRERIFIDTILKPIIADFPELRIVLEHISTQYAAEFIQDGSANIAATITAHHLLLNRNTLLVGGIKPHLYCLPVLKTATDQQALLAAASSGNPKFFLGTDSAPHSQSQKECACGNAGIYTAHAAIELYAEVFEQMQALDKLEGFASLHGADFYGLPRNQQKITLIKKPWQVPRSLSFAEDVLIPFRSAANIGWTLAADPN